ncbi:stage II sporulation protein M [Paenibacillus sp. 453mf]|nr:stage II sporulation protein M [Paenibacillus sp. 453mf]
MRKGTTLTMLFLKHTFRDQTPLYVFVAVLFLVGVIFGALMVGALTLDQQQDLAGYLDNFFVTMNQGNSSGSTYMDIAMLHLKWVGLIWVLGLSVIGLPGILILDFLKGVLIGFTVGYMVGQYSWKGLLLAMVSVAPHNLLVIPVILICSVAAITFSLHMIKSRFFMNRNGGVKRPLTSYIGLTVAMAGLMLAISSFETWITPLLMQWVAPLFV